MRVAVSLVLVFISFGMCAADEPGTAVGHFVAGFATTLLTVMDAGNQLWTRLANRQAADVLQQVSTSAASLQNQKTELRNDLDNNRISDSSNLANRITLLKAAVRDLDETLLKFAEEIDTAAHPVGEDLRIELKKAELGKLDELTRVETAWKAGNPAARTAAIKELDLAVVDLELMREAISCLQNTITNQKPACVPRRP